MAPRDPAKAIKNALATEWATNNANWTATLHVDDDFTPTAGSPLVLVADDGGPAAQSGAWMTGKTLYRPVIRMTAFAQGRDEALSTINDTVEWLLANRPPEVSRIDGVTYPLVTRDKATGTYLAWVTMPVLVRQSA